jgi:hypothetical protein
MIIKLSPASPLSRDVTLQVFKSGDTLTINGVVLDFSRLAKGSTLPADAISCNSITQPVERIGDDLVVRLDLPCWSDSIEAARFPVDIHSPADGQVLLPGLYPGEQLVEVPGVIDWSQVITAEVKALAAAEHLLSVVVADLAQRRAVADAAIAPLQDAVELDLATDAEASRLKDWKRYRVALSRLPEQDGYPNAIDWPAPPA